MDVKLPNLGEGADSGTVVSLLVKEGDTVSQGQTLLELENEKAVAPIPSPAAGTIGAIRVKEGDKISVGQVILTLAGGDGAQAAPGPGAAAKPARRKPAEPEAEPEEEEFDDSESATEAEADDETNAADQAGLPIAASPTIRRIARDLGINLRRIRGAGRGRRIELSDLRAYVQRLIRLSEKAAAKGGKSTRPIPESIDFSKWGPVTKKSMSPLRKTISERMVENWTAIPHVTQFDEADITEMMAARKKAAPGYKEKGANLTLTCIALKAVVQTLQKHPIFNASIDELAGEVVYKEYFHIGLAVDTEYGLIVPVIRDVDKKDLLTLAKELASLAERTRERKVGLEELKGGTFTISNQGGIGGAHFTPIINKPEVAILGIGKGINRAGVKGGKIEPRLMLPLALSYDHRLIDGGQAARFIQDLLGAFENFKEADMKL